MTKPSIEFDSEKHIYTVNGVKMPSVSELIEPITAKHYGSINKEMLEMAALRGTIVHEACEDIDYDLEVEVSEEYAGYVEAYVKWLTDYKPEMLGIELMLYCDAYKFCGTVDRWCVIDGEECVVDIKTTTSPTKANYIAGCLQTRAYQIALESAKRRFLLYLKANGEYRLVDCDEYEKRHNFNSTSLFGLCLDIYEETERNWK